MTFKQGTNDIHNFDASLLSTTAAAKKHNVSAKYLLAHLISNNYLRKENRLTRLTDKGVSIGGSYREYEGGKSSPIWPDKNISEIIKRTDWPVDISRSLEIIRDQAKIRLKIKNADTDYLYQKLERGTKILDCDDSLDKYICAFSKMHKAKLFHAFEELNRQENLKRLVQNKQVQIIDYGCGQGMASIVFIEYLRSRKIDYKIKEALLIDPSKKALEKCGAHLTGNIVRSNKKFDDLVENDISSNESFTKFHFFSNILDMGGEHFDLEHLAEVIINSQQGINYFVCVSVRESAKLAQFMKYFAGRAEISSFEGELENLTNPSKPWHLVEKIFRVEF